MDNISIKLGAKVGFLVESNFSTEPNRLVVFPSSTPFKSLNPLSVSPNEAFFKPYFTSNNTRYLSSYKIP